MNARHRRNARRCRLMNFVRRPWHVGIFALHFGVLAGQSLAADPKIFAVSLAEVDASDQMAPEPQGGDVRLPRRKLGYQRMRETLWHGSHIAALLAEGANPNASSSEGEPVLFYAIRHHRRDHDNLEDLLRAGADPNGKSRDGTTPLHLAIWHNNDDAIRLLLKFGADPLATKSGRNAIEYAQANDQRLVPILKADRPPPTKPTPYQPPKVLREPDAILGSAQFRPPAGGEAVIYSNDSRQVITGDGGGAIRVFDARSGEIQNSIAAHEREILELAPIPGSSIVVSSSAYATKFWDMSSSQELLRLRRGGRGLSVSPNGRWVFTGYHLWEIESTEPLRLSATGRGYPQAGGKVIISWTFFTPDNRYLIFGVQNGFVYIWDLNNDYVRRIGDLEVTAMQSLTWGNLTGIADIGDASPDDLLALATSQYTILTGPAATLHAFQPIVKTQVRDARSLACSPNGQFLAAYGYPSRIDVFDLERDGEVVALDGHTAALQAIAASPRGDYIASGGDDKTVLVWNRRTGKPVTRLPTESFVYSLCFAADGTQLAVGDNSSNVYLFDIPSGDLKRRWSVGGRITSLQFNSEGDALIVLGYQLTVLSLTTGAKIAAISSGAAQQGTLAVTPGNIIIGSANSMAAGETFKVPAAWSFDNNRLTPRGELFSEAMGHRTTIHTVATSPNGSLLAAESDAIRLWDLRLQRCLGDKLCGHTRALTSMEFSGDGQLLASSAWDGTARIWDVATGRLLLVLDADVYRVSGAAFLPDGGLVTANWNGTIHMWNVPRHLRNLSR